ncbi:MAG TPA: aldo/keto reductase [Acidobacteriaceae bacterium]|nr:aldo/keto reductase [Acidobacteriaceae bacterium]
MQHIRLASSGRETSRLGFGCSVLMAGISRRQSARLLDAAYDAGIRHFDVAPLYGYGEAESCVGDLLARHPDITITTKFGIDPPARGGLIRTVRRVASPVLQRVPALKRLARSAGATAAPPAKSNFNAAEARASLERSLRNLRTTQIDILLLHEPESTDLTDTALLDFLNNAVAQDNIGGFGIASDSTKVSALLRDRPAYCRIVQHDWSILNPLEPKLLQPAFHIHHRALTEHLPALHDALTRDKERCRRWSQITGRDLARREVLAALMLKAALVLHPNTVLLVSSKNPVHIRENVRVAEDASLEEPARRLHQLVQREGLASAAN